MNKISYYCQIMYESIKRLYEYDNYLSTVLNNNNIEYEDITNFKDKSDIIVDNVIVVNNSNDNYVYIDYDNSTITCNLNTFELFEVVKDNEYISITQNDSLSNFPNTGLVYVLSGSSDDGQFQINGSYKCEVNLEGLTLNCKNGSPIDIQCGKKVEISIKKGTTNTLTDESTSNASQKACLYSKGHIKFKGQGILNVTGNYAHAISAKEYIYVQKATINILDAVKDAINCNQYFEMVSGNINIDKSGNDGIQCSLKGDESTGITTDHDDEDSGNIYLEGGNITVSNATDKGKCIKADGDIYVTGETVNATSTGGAVYDSSVPEVKSTACICCDGEFNMSDGTLILVASGAGGKGINCDGECNISGGTINITTSGGPGVYANGTLYQGTYTGNLDNINSDLKTSPKGIKCDSNVNISGGTISVNTSGVGGEGIESKSVMTISNGDITINAYDDGLNASNNLHITGGTLVVVSQDNDALDANGNLIISGGNITALGANAPECGIDANEEEQYTVVLSGGNVLAFGAGNSIPNSSYLSKQGLSSTQAYVNISTSISAGKTIKINDSQNTSWMIPSTYSQTGNNLLISTPYLVSGNIYTVTIGSSTITGTAQLTGSSNTSGGGTPGGDRPR